MSAPSMAGRVGLVAVPLAGVLAIVAGILVTRSAPPFPFAWVASAPLTDETLVPGLAAQFWLGPGLVGLGIALLAGWIGFLLGRRRRG